MDCSHQIPLSMEFSRQEYWSGLLFPSPGESSQPKVWTWISCIAEAPILWPPDMKNWLIGKDPDAGKDWRQEEKGMREDEMVGWHHQHDGPEFEQALEVGDRQGKPGVLQSMGLQRVRHDWVIELNWTPALQADPLSFEPPRTQNSITYP